MRVTLQNLVQRLYQKLSDLCDYVWFDFILVGLFWAEAFFFPVPMDPLLIVATIKRPHKALYYGIIATLASALGGVCGYFLGLWLWDSVGLKLIHLFTTQDKFEKVCHLYQSYEYWTVLIGGFTPFPYKAITISAGFCQLSLLPFILCSIASRGTRFILVALLAKRYGIKIKHYIDRYGLILLLIFKVLCIISIGSLK